VEEHTIDPHEFENMFEFEPSLIGDTLEDQRATQRVSAMFSVHGHVLILVAGDPDAQVSGIAAKMKLSEAAVGRVLADLVASNLVAKVETGTCTRHVLTSSAPAGGMLTAPRSVAAVTRLYGYTA